jgi:hypothetical protein
MSEINWRYVSAQAGLGKNVKVGSEAGKSVGVCITENENPLRSHVARLRAESQGVKENVLPMTLSPRVPAPAIVGLAEGRLMGGGAKRSLKRTRSSEDKENDVANHLRELKKKELSPKKHSTRRAVQQAFPDIPEQQNIPEDAFQPRRISPPLRESGSRKAPSEASSNGTGTKLATSISQPTLAQRVPNEVEPPENPISNAKRVLRGTKEADIITRAPTQAELNVPARVPPRVQLQRAALKRSAAQDNLKQVNFFSEIY